MIDRFFRSSYQRFVIAPLLSSPLPRFVSPHQCTLIAALTGLFLPLLLLFHHPYLAFTALLISGFFDTLDGSLARHVGASSPQGAVIDILADRLVELSIIIGLYLVHPQTRGALCLAMLGASLLCITSFLVVGIFQKNESEKSFHYSPGLIERAEAFLFFGAMILFPSLFTILAAVFTLLVLMTAASRVYQFSILSTGR